MPKYGYDVPMPGGGFARVCGDAPRRRRCWHCNRLTNLLCDGPVAVGKTCDRPVCANCRTVGGPDTDYCRDCARDWPGPAKGKP